MINNKKELYSFKMNRIFDDTATQEQLFEGIGKPVVENVLQGFNGTIFAYVRPQQQSSETEHTARSKGSAHCCIVAAVVAL